jgi:hypothetical protein
MLPYSYQRILQNNRKRDIILNNVRLIKFDELNELLELYKFLNPDDPDLKGTDYITQLWIEIFNDPGRYYFVVEEDGRLVSACMLAIVKNLTQRVQK